MNLLSVREELDLYDVNDISTVRLLSDLTGAKEDVVSELIKNHKGIISAIDNASFEKNNLSKRQLEKFEILGELIKRSSRDKMKLDGAITSPEKAVEFFEDLRYEPQEVFQVLLLNTKNVPIKRVIISKGSNNVSIVHPRDVMREAVKYNANSIMLCHNHPSGNTTPSKEDREITNRLIDAGELMGIRVLDHIIIGGNSYLSFKEMHYM